MMAAMPSRKEDIEFLRAYLRELRKWYEDSAYLVASDLYEPSEKQRAEYEATEERVARLADANGFDGKFFRDYLFPEPPPLSVEDLRQVGSKIETVPRIIAKLEESEQDEKADGVALMDKDLTLLHDMAAHQGECRSRLTISMATKLPESTLKPVLRRFEERGWIHRPSGQRSGFVITPQGVEYFKKIWPQ
jgi:hypothetical protein